MMGNGASPGPFARELRFRFGRHLPMVVQAESAECGLACLAMIAGYHGHHAELAALRLRFPQSLKGATARQLIDIAQSLGLQARALRLAFPAPAALRAVTLTPLDGEGLPGHEAQRTALGPLWDEMVLVRDGGAEGVGVLDDEIAIAEAHLARL